MKHKRRCRIAVVILAVSLSAGVLGGCGGSSSGKVPPAPGSVLSAATPTAGLESCASCHGAETNDWLTSKHANLGADGAVYSAGVPTLGLVQAGGPACVACHDPNGDSAQLTAGYTGNVPRPVIGCETCHGPGSLHANAGGSGPISLLSNTTTPGPVSWNSGTVQVSEQFIMCTSCHELLDASGTGTNPSPAHATTAPTGTQYAITDTHFAVPGLWTGPPNGRTNTAGYNVAGYAMDFSSETVCTDCHNPHQTADIDREWASSKHADRDYKAPWSHYNWSTQKACQRCHTTTGFAAYADALAGGNLTRAEAIRTGTIVSAPIASTANWKPEMLKCNGCHTDDRGGLRNPGAYVATYTIGAIPNANVTYQYPDLGRSNVCMTCHTGRNSGKAVNQLDTGQTATVNFGNYGYSNVDAHYLTAGGTMFKGTGYEYAGRSYTDPDSFKHYQLGTPLAPNTGSDGPCISCHMYRTGQPGNHLFEPVTDVSGTITNVSSEVCYNCHAGSSTALAAMIDQEKKNYADALSALGDRLAALGYYFIPAYPTSGIGSFPYIFTTPTLAEPQTDCTQNIPAMELQTGGTTTCTGTPPNCACTGEGTGTPGTGKNNMGAAFNMSLLSHEPGAYVHNSRYAKRLIYDSIDWLDDGVLNYSVGTTLDTVCTATPAAWCDGAKSYLLFGAPGTASERP